MMMCNGIQWEYTMWQFSILEAMAHSVHLVR